MSALYRLLFLLSSRFRIKPTYYRCHFHASISSLEASSASAPVAECFEKSRIKSSYGFLFKIKEWWPACKAEELIRAPCTLCSEWPSSMKVVIVGSPQAQAVRPWNRASIANESAGSKAAETSSIRSEVIRHGRASIIGTSSHGWCSFLIFRGPYRHQHLLIISGLTSAIDDRWRVCHTHIENVPITVTMLS